MRIAVLSDVHGNLHALQAVWRDLEAQAPDAVYCLGDLVGYGAFPNEVIQFIRRHNLPTVMGNYDEGVGFDLDDCGCAYSDPQDDARGKQSLRWSREHTTAENKAFLQSLPRQLRIRTPAHELLLVHGSPRKINEYLYEDRPEATFRRVAGLVDAGILFFGHTHLPYQKQVDGIWFVNTGTVGKPKDGDPRAGYLIAELEREPSFSYRRVGYDVSSAVRAIRGTDLPAEFAAMLERGADKVSREGEGE